MKTRNQFFGSVITALLLCAFGCDGLAAPRPPLPPWPQTALRVFGFDSAYANVPWRNLALNEEAATLPESWNGYALSREGLVGSPVIIPVQGLEKEVNVAPARGMIRFWFAPNWSTASKTSGGAGPGHAARLLELVNVNGAKAQTRWALFLNDAGDTISLAGETKLGAAVVLQAPVEFQADVWQMITLCYSETNTLLLLNNEVIAKGDGLAAPLAWEEKDLGLVLGSDVLASVDSLAEGQFEELTTFAQWPKKSDGQEFYYRAMQRRSLLGPVGSKAEEQAKIAALKTSGALPEDYGVAKSGGEGDGPIVLYSYAAGYLWLEITSVTNDLAHLIVHGTTEDVAYEILTKEALTNAEWAGEQVILGATGQDWTPTTVPVGTRTNHLFFWARTLVDTDGDGLPDWWESEHGLDPNNPDTGDTGVSDGYKDGDSDGWTNLQEYQNGTGPGQFNTPAAPQGFAVTTDATGTYAKLTWLPASGPVTGYTVERGSDNSTVGLNSSTTSYTDTQTNLPSGLYQDWVIPQYRVRAEYSSSSGSWSVWQAVADLAAPVAQFIFPQSSSATVIVPELPAATVTVRVGVATNDFGQYFDVDSVDIPAAEFTNGVATLPAAYVQMATTNLFTFRYVQFILTNTAQSAVAPAGLNSLTPFWDGRAQLKDNLRFRLRAASPYQSFGFVFRYGNTVDYSYGADNQNYEYAGYHDVWEDSGTGYTYHRFEPLLPFYENHLYRNLVFNDTNLTTQGLPTTGADWWFGELRFTWPGTHSFSPPANPTPLASVLTLAETRWTCWSDLDEPQFGVFDWVNVGVTLTFNQNNQPAYTMSSGAQNWFGLPYESVKLAWDSLSGPVATTILQPGGSFYANDWTLLGYPWGYFYPETATPQFQSEGYYFARVVDGQSSDVPLPGHTLFASTNPAPLLIASVGDPNYKLFGFAKLAVTNGYAGVYGYLGQYFDRAYTTTNGVMTTNETGILSPYGEFFPTEPGRTTLVTLPDLETNERGTATVYVVSVNLDANHDGTMDRTFYGPDQTSANRPFRFWINNDNDSYRGEDFDASWRRDSDDNTIGNTRELEDFARLWISGLPSLPATNGYAVTLSWRNYTGNPTIKLYPASEADGGNLYLQATNVALEQIAYTNNAGILTGPGACMATSTPNATFTFPANYFLNVGRKHFLFEGVERGSGELVMTIAQGTNNLAETSVFMDLRDVKEMYERWSVGEAGTVEPLSTPFLAADGLPVGTSPFQYPHNSTTDTNTPYILHVHGWNMTTWSKNSYGETGFKRLYWQGYSGRYGIFRWPTYFNFPGLGFDLQAFDLNNYEKSEWQAWKSATGLRTLLTNLNGLYPQRVRVTGHSMGNVVVGEALRISSNAPALAVVYAALEAAIPSHCYDSGATNREIPWVLDNVTPNVYASYWQAGNSNYFYGFQGADVYVNFFNARDYALVKWELGQNLKPAQSMDYTYNAGLSKFYRGSTEMTFPADRHEILSFCAEPRCYALGAQQNVAGLFAPSMAVQVNLDIAPFNFGDEIPGHSGQFRFRIQTCWPFWDELLKALELKSR